MKKRVMLKKRIVLGGIVCKPGMLFSLISVRGKNAIIRNGGQEFSVNLGLIVEVDEYNRPIKGIISSKDVLRKEEEEEDDNK